MNEESNTKVCYVLSAESAEKHQERAVETAEQKCSSRRELRWREGAAIVCSTEVLQRAAKSF
jgi:hypothetical protein